MSLFKRKGRSEGADQPAEADVDTDIDTETGTQTDTQTDTETGGEPAGTGGGVTRVAGVGPFDAADVEGADGRLDVGALWLPLVDGVELQLQMDEATGEVTGVFVVLGESAVQLQAFAAPRHEGIWREICDEIAAGITEQGGTADEGTGVFGHELLARVPNAGPDGRVGFQPLRFTGVDGPRWLLRAVFHGQAAIDPAAAEALEALVADVVVVRGGEPMGPRELLPLHLPAGAVAPQDGDENGDENGDGANEPLQGDEGPATVDDLNPFERGPEITERR